IPTPPAQLPGLPQCTSCLPYKCIGCTITSTVTLPTPCKIPSGAACPTDTFPAQVPRCPGCPTYRYSFMSSYVGKLRVAATNRRIAALKACRPLTSFTLALIQLLARPQSRPLRPARTQFTTCLEVYKFMLYSAN